ncbi:cyclin-dependent kinase inhibitor 1-like isoform X1 [Acropora millepora]|uniref:cyclin-dependent kinase inhibitor 1-like isoform X1 n=2 Tax=Acropora millepora TaxID=45264 RepID=UPI0010FCA885|nr:cyclin-dependent kinase inhibitor 1-like isoform X1 [Acropora millepora]
MLPPVMAMAFTQGVTSSSSRRRERPNIVPSRSVCRNLFGPVDHEQLKADFLREKEEIIKEDTRKWNFDFENDIPLLGRYLWEKMYSDLARERTTSSFSSRASEGKATNERSSCTTVAEHPDVTPSATSLDMAHRTIQISDNVDSEKPESEKCDPKMTPRKLRSRSSTGKITDFLRPRKQRRSVKRLQLKTRESTSKQTSLDVLFRKH